MECIEERALKPSFLVKANSQLLHNDDVWCLAGISSVSADDFPVEDLLNLDFTEKDIQSACCSLQENDEEKVAYNYHSSSGADELDSLSAAELAIPVDDVENLEWLSQFVDDSAPEHSFSSISPTASFKDGGGGGGGVHGKLLAELLSRPVHKKPRSKRSRPPHVRPSAELSPLPLLLFTKPAAEKQLRKPNEGAGSVSGRRCVHCQVQKTPQWRTGPLGPKTLCNACGVRFKSGRLFPEYRPACSPTFSQELHSNSHRKVLEKRRRVIEPGSELVNSLTFTVLDSSLQ